MNYAKSILGCLGLALLLLSGCGGEQFGTVTGTVKLKGEPTGGFEVVFKPTSGGAEGMGYTKADGTYSLVRGRGIRDLLVGEYRVTINPTTFVAGVPEPKVKLPATVSKMDQTTILKTIQPGSNVIDIEIEP